MVFERKESCIEVCSMMNEWINCIVLVKQEDKERAVEVLEEAYESFWDENCPGELCYGDLLEASLREAGIRYGIFFTGDSEE